MQIFFGYNLVCFILNTFYCKKNFCFISCYFILFLFYLILFFTIMQKNHYFNELATLFSTTAPSAAAVVVIIVVVCGSSSKYLPQHTKIVKRPQRTNSSHNTHQDVCCTLNSIPSIFKYSKRESLMLPRSSMKCVPRAQCLSGEESRD